MIPQYLDLRRVSLKNAIYKGSLPGDDGSIETLKQAFPYLSDALVGVQRIQAILEFSAEQSKAKLIRGSVFGVFELQCQRCLEPAPLLIDRNIAIACVFDETDMAQVNDSFEPWLLNPDDKLLDIYAVLQEEFLLALPNSHYHGSAQTDDLAKLVEDKRADFSDLVNLDQSKLKNWDKLTRECQAIDLSAIGKPPVSAQHSLGSTKRSSDAVSQVTEDSGTSRNDMVLSDSGVQAFETETRQDGLPPGPNKGSKGSWQQGDQNPFNVLSALKDKVPTK